MDEQAPAISLAATDMMFLYLLVKILLLVRDSHAKCSGLGTVQMTKSDDSRTNDCKHPDRDQFMTRLKFQATGAGAQISLSDYACVYQRCCNVALKTDFKPEQDVDYDDDVAVDNSLTGLTGLTVQFRCITGNHRIVNTTAVCERVTENGDGWNLLPTESACLPCPVNSSYNSDTNMCDCSAGSYLDGEQCKPCRKGYVSEAGETKCTACPKDQYTENTGSSVCASCPQDKVSLDGVECVCKAGTFLYEGTCEYCSPGEFSEAGGSCQDCPAGRYSSAAGSVECAPCPLDMITIGSGANECFCRRGTVRSIAGECEYCPAGHTTYRANPDTCVGPALTGYDGYNKHSPQLQLSVGLESLGSLESSIKYWESRGDWFLNMLEGRKRIIKEKYTLGRSRPRKIRTPAYVFGAQPIIRDVFCYTDSEDYEGYMPSCQTEDGPQGCDIPKCKDTDTGVIERGCDYTEFDRTVSATPSQIVFKKLSDSKILCDKLGKDCSGVLEIEDGSYTTISVDPSTLSGGDLILLVKSATCGNPYHEEYFEQTYQNRR